MLLPDVLFKDRFDVRRVRPSVQDAGILVGGTARPAAAAPIPVDPPVAAAGVPGIRYYRGGASDVSRVTPERALSPARYRVLFRTGADVRAGDLLDFEDGVTVRAINLLRQGGGITQADCEGYDG